MFNTGRFCRRPLQRRHPRIKSLSHACQLFEEMPNRKSIQTKTLRSYYPNPLLNSTHIGSRMVGQYSSSSDSSGNNSKFSTPRLLQVAALSCTKFIGIIIRCVGEHGILTGKQFHCLLIKCGFSSNRYIGSSFVTMYSKCGLVEEARSLFEEEISFKDLVIWNAMISCYSLNGLWKEAFRLYKSMRLTGFIGDGFTFSSLLSSCSSMESCNSYGKQTHGIVIRLAFDFDVGVGTSLIGMYSKCGCIGDARRAFNVMNHDIVAFWNAIIVGYGQHGDGKETMKLLTQMIRGGFRPDEITLANILSSCADSAMTTEAAQVHGCVVKYGFQNFTSTGNALIMAYAKSGSLSNALRCFHSLSAPDIISCTSMITSYAFHGHAEEALNMFERMLLGGVKPDKVAFLGVLSACSHAGLVERGLHYFVSMKNGHQIEPSLEHYACLVDLLGRSGHLNEAYGIIANMPFEPDENVLGAFIGACKVHGNIELAKWAADGLFSVEPNESANYKLMSNMYSGLGFWDDVARVRQTMKDKCGDRAPGCSWTENGGGVVHSVVSNDESHPQALGVYSMHVENAS